MLSCPWEAIKDNYWTTYYSDSTRVGKFVLLRIFFKRHPPHGFCCYKSRVSNKSFNYQQFLHSFFDLSCQYCTLYWKSFNRIFASRGATRVGRRWEEEKIVALIAVIHNQVLSLLSHWRPGRQRAIHRYKHKKSKRNKKFYRYCSVRGSVSGQVVGCHRAKEDPLKFAVALRSLNPSCWCCTGVEVEQLKRQIIIIVMVAAASCRGGSGSAPAENEFQWR